MSPLHWNYVIFEWNAELCKSSGTICFYHVIMELLIETSLQQILSFSRSEVITKVWWVIWCVFKYHLTVKFYGCSIWLTKPSFNSEERFWRASACLWAGVKNVLIFTHMWSHVFYRFLPNWLEAGISWHEVLHLKFLCTYYFFHPNR